MSPISCQLHDYIEIACLYGYDIKLKRHQLPDIHGRAITTETSSGKKEYLILQTPNGNEKIELSDIASMTAITGNSHFDLVKF